MSKPYYEADGITIYHGDCREILVAGEILITDPPYGIRADVEQSARANTQRGKALAKSRDYGVSDWDNSAPEELLLGMLISRSRHQIIWGGNYFKLPPSRGWLVWDKDNGENRYADCELAWTNLDQAVRRFRYRWMGMLQENMADKEERVHPTQKPIPLLNWCISQIPSDGIILDPFMGSGTTLRAAKELGRKAIGIEIEERYCEIAAKRLSQQVLPL